MVKSVRSHSIEWHIRLPHSEGTLGSWHPLHCTWDGLARWHWIQEVQAIWYEDGEGPEDLGLILRGRGIAREFVGVGDGTPRDYGKFILALYEKGLVSSPVVLEHFGRAARR